MNGPGADPNLNSPLKLAPFTCPSSRTMPEPSGNMKPAQNAPVSASGNPAAASPAKARILIVDDEPTNVLLLERILTKADYTKLSKTCDPREVLPLTEAFLPDLILLDLHMPHIDGFEVLVQLREKIPAGEFLPVLVLTADITPQAKLRALANGATDFVTKPFDKSEVLLRVGNLLHTRRLQQQIQAQNETLEQMVQQRTLELQRTVIKLQETQQQVVQQERLHALGMMASGVAHDFNNALSVILGFGEIVLQDCQRIPAAKPLAAHVQTIVTAAMDGAEMVTRLREFYRPAGGDVPKLAIDLNALCEQAINLTQPRWKTQAQTQGRVIEMVTSFSPVPPIAGDAAEIREALTNLIFNAVDAMPSGGSISLHTSHNSEGVILHLSDTGTGMSEEVRRRCLEPFFSTKGEKGTGLGLAMVYGIVERHGGTMEIQSEVGKGTTFIIHLPCGESVAGTREPAVGEVERLLNILVVDDQPVLCEMFTEYLRHDWHNVETACDGQDALEKFRSATFDLVITDLAMPGMTGEQLAAAIKAISPATPVVLLTGFSNYMTPQSDGPRIIDEVLCKPISLIDMRKAIVRAIVR